MNVIQKYKNWLDKKIFEAALKQSALANLRRSRVTEAIVALERVKADWRLAGPLEFAGLPTDSAAWVWSCDGLAAFFDACADETSGKTVALPSLAADAVWHAWLRVDQAGLDAFCVARYGRAFPHQPKSEMTEPMDEALARAWANNCRAEKIDPLAGKVPSLFALDAKLRVPGGRAYLINTRTGRLSHAKIGHKGVPHYSTEVGLPGMTAAGLLAAGAITSSEYAEWMSVPDNAAAIYKKQLGASGGGGGSSCGMGTFSGCGGGGSHGVSHAGSHAGSHGGGGSHGDGGGSHGDGGGHHGGGDGGGGGDSSGCGSSCGGGCGGGGGD